MRLDEHHRGTAGLNWQPSRAVHRTPGLNWRASFAKLYGCSLIAQLVERRTVNPQVPGSSPGRGAKFTRPCSNARPCSFPLSVDLCTALQSTCSETSAETPPPTTHQGGVRASTADQPLQRCMTASKAGPSTSGHARTGLNAVTGRSTDSINGAAQPAHQPARTPGRHHTKR